MALPYFFYDSSSICLLYTSDAADELDGVDLGGRRIIKKIWKCNDELDFLYGYYVGKIEEGSLHYLLKATRASAGGYVDTFEIRGIIEENKIQLQETIKNAVN